MALYEQECLGCGGSFGLGDAGAGTVANHEPLAVSVCAMMHGTVSGPRGWGNGCSQNWTIVTTSRQCVAA